MLVGVFYGYREGLVSILEKVKSVSKSRYPSWVGNRESRELGRHNRDNEGGKSRDGGWATWRLSDYECESSLSSHAVGLNT